MTLLEIHKLMYFMDVAGEPLKLEFKKGYYGPYSEKLRHVLRLWKAISYPVTGTVGRNPASESSQYQGVAGRGEVP